MRDVVITGAGLCTPIGHTLADAWATLASGRSVVRRAAALTETRVRAASFMEDDFSVGIPSSTVKMTDRVGLMGLHAADRAMADAGLAPGSFDAYRFGTLVGFGAGPSEAMYAGHVQLLQKDMVGAMTLLKMLPNGPASQISMRHGLKGECLTYSIACSSSAAAIGNALRMIRHGYLDQALVGGVEAPLGESTFRAWEAMRVLGRVDPENPSNACRPYSKDRTGIVLGEGAALFVIEAEEVALARGARIYARLKGYGASADAGHITLPGQPGQVAAMRAAMKDAGVTTADIGYINAHGTATGQGDTIETKSVREVFAERADQTPMSATKSVHGHMLGASAAVELVACLQALLEGVLPPTVNLNVPDPECDLDYVPNVARRGVKVDAVMSNSFAFGGSNASLILTR
jgi:3-oxoacyl-[acyl-carrier-protein] synthase II